MKSLPRPTARQIAIFVMVFVFGLGWALYTQHAWEDYYITFRASKNLATGHGLTFTEGERVHSFTSPLGVLLPALTSALTGNHSDDAALWLFRVISLCAYAGAAVVLYGLFRAVGMRAFATGLLTTLFAIDCKIVDYSTNGQETGFLVFFLSWALYAHIVAPRRQSLHLGLAWAGLMWSRPDSCVYIAALATAALLFRPPTPLEGGRLEQLKRFAVAGAITSAIYLPWLVWTWSYYGTLIPHTITAKGLFHSPLTPRLAYEYVRDFPRAVTAHLDMLAMTYMPPYASNTGWPAPMLRVTYWVALACLVIWIVPRIRWEVRFASFCFCVGQFYITSFVSFPVPWYMPTITVFSLVTLAGLIGQLEGRSRRLFARGLGVLLIAGSLTITVLGAQQLKLQQAIIERGVREKIGRWLRDHAASQHDTVFLEPLGYIGFYSGLKMYDFPGLSSPEVVAARRRTNITNYPDCWPTLILDLTPSWLVLRSYEADAIRRLAPDILTRRYSLAKVFDVRKQVEDLPFIMGRGYLTNDAYFEVYHRNGPSTRNGIELGRVVMITASDLKEKTAWSGAAYDSGPNIVANAPSVLVVPKPKGARWVSGGLGIFEGAYARPTDSTDGADFRIYFVSRVNGKKTEVFHRFLNPRDVATDRGLQAFSAELPVDEEGDVRLETGPGPNHSDAYDWTYWSSPMLEFPRRP